MWHTPLVTYWPLIHIFLENLSLFKYPSFSWSSSIYKHQLALTITQISLQELVSRWTYDPSSGQWNERSLLGIFGKDQFPPKWGDIRRADSPLLLDTILYEYTVRSEGEQERKEEKTWVLDDMAKPFHELALELFNHLVMQDDTFPTVQVTLKWVLLLEAKSSLTFCLTKKHSSFLT